MLCLGKKKDGGDCTTPALKGEKYCRHHPGGGGEEDAVIPQSRVNRYFKSPEDYEAEVKERQEIIDFIMSVDSHDKLLYAQKLVAAGLINGSIDAKAGPALQQALKHITDLITKIKPPEEDMNEEQRKRLLEKAKEMTGVQAWQLLQDFVGSVKALAKAPPAETVIDAAIDVTPIPPLLEVSADESGQPENAPAECDGVLEQTGGDETEVF